MADDVMVHDAGSNPTLTSARSTVELRCCADVPSAVRLRVPVRSYTLEHRLDEMTQCSGDCPTTSRVVFSDVSIDSI